MIRLDSGRSLWLVLYLACNVVAAAIMLVSGENMGDVAMAPVPGPRVVLGALLCVLVSYALILGPLFSFLARGVSSVRKVSIADPAELNRMGLIVLALQVAFFAFNEVYGVNVAGSRGKSADTPLSMFWVFVPIDAIFLIYFSLSGSSKYKGLNLAVWVLSSLVRGWAGIFVFLLYFWVVRSMRAGKLTVVRFAASMAVALIAFPVISNLKWIVRAGELSNGSAFEVIAKVAERVSAEDYSNLVIEGGVKLVERIQVVSVLSEVIEQRELLRREFYKGGFQPFWSEGLHGIIYDRLAGNQRAVPLGVYFTNFINTAFSFEQGDWNVNTSYVAWLVVLPSAAVGYIFYTFMLCAISVGIGRKIENGEQFMDVVWLAWLIYLLPPWWTTFVQFIYAMVVFYLLRGFIRKVPRLTIYGSRVR